VHDVNRAQTRDPGSDTTVRPAPPNQSSQNPQILEGAVDPLSPDQHSLPFWLCVRLRRLQHRSTATAPYRPTSPSSYEREPVHDVDRAQTCDPGSDTTIRAASPNQSSQNPQVMERGGGPSYTPDQLPHTLAMTEGAGCTCGMATAPLNRHRTIRAHVAPDNRIVRCSSR
jgi:hypothetical protein